MSSDNTLSLTADGSLLSSNTAAKVSFDYPNPPGFELREEIGRGGMGVVYRAYDTNLCREVAVKFLQPRYEPTSRTAERFLEEARITGQLQHPGIPAVYQVSWSENGRPFLAMKLIQGQTLDQIHREGKAIDLLAVFEGICQAVGYAHVHGVLHRDLKPANIMIGAFGEVQVMDWGLAKVLGTTRSTPETPEDLEQVRDQTTIKSHRESAGTFTQAGSIMGTPAFMPPEQAAGETDKVDCRSDVFGLGAILCLLITGRAPFSGENAEKIRLNAVRGHMPEVLEQLKRSAVEPGLVELCVKCLSFDRESRPQDANVLAKAVRGLRQAADARARQAELEQRASEVRMEGERRRRRLVQRAIVAVAAVLLLGIIGTTVGMVNAVQARNAAIDERNAKMTALQREQEQRQAADAAYALSRESLVKVCVDLPEVLRQAIYTREARTRSNEILAEAMNQQLDPRAIRGLPGRTTLSLRIRAGDAQLELGKVTEAEKNYREALSVSQELQDAGGDDAAITKGNHALVLSRLAVLERDSKKTAEAVRQSLNQLGQAEKLQRELLDNPPNTERSAAELRQSIASTRIEEAGCYRLLSQFTPAAQALVEAIDLLAPRPDDGASNRYNQSRQLQRANAILLLAKCHISLLDDVVAEKTLKQATEAFASLLKEDPKNPLVRLAAARAYREQGDFLLMRNRLADLGTIYQDGVNTLRELLETPEVNALKFELGDNYYRTATLALKQKNQPLATEHYTRCRNLWREVTEVSKSNRNQLAVYLAEARLGNHRDGAAYARKLTAGPPSNDTIQAVCVLALCAEALTQGRPASALNDADRALRKEYLQAAINGLKTLVDKAGYRNLSRLKTDPDLDPLREEPEFQAILKQLSSAKP